MPDKYEEKMAEFERLPDNDRKASMKTLEGMCTCPLCPTYTECARTKSELLYCFEGKSPSCITKPVKCICPTCPVEVDYAIKNMFYCIEGSEADKRKRRAERQKQKMMQNA